MRGIKLIIVGLGLVIAITAAYSPVACGIDPQTINFAIKPVNVPCAPNKVIVEVKVTGWITLADQQAQFFKVRLVDEDLIPLDDTLVELEISSDLQQDPWVQGELREFEFKFELTCNTKTSCNDVSGIGGSAAGGNILAPMAQPGMIGQVAVIAIGRSSENNPNLALEIDTGRIVQKGNYYDGYVKNRQQGNPVQAKCIKAGVPTLTEWGLIVLGLLLAGSLAFMIRRRYAVQHAGA